MPGASWPGCPNPCARLESSAPYAAEVSARLQAMAQQVDARTLAAAGRPEPGRA